MRMLKYTISIFIVFVLLVCSCEQNKVVPKHSKDTINIETAPDQVSWDNEVLFVDSSYTKSKLKAKKAMIFRKRMQTVLEGGLYAEFYSRYTKKRMSYLTADKAEIDDRTKNMLARGNVVVVSDSSKTKVETQLLHWNNKTQMFYSSEFVKVTSPNEIIQGYGFESDQDLVNYKIFRVSGERK
ncbi:MAG: LPS export ABC transporter periplasmic protein LptC [Ignavibacteria bacterium GWB2_35_12]|nr:MAG: LPS export ABC transporter periplasmic protein LptC [Ignavibacteria bacterium GWA2_35_8]OGU41615.1 MAG: LPS export ABC transporter periplasmic protein LptC [Ignavibacteria bacterium GWB2_35_12]OGU91355.1 MAG: LPS export ABC transporter periplasmic protein LptC [Ignavibacteria bacterium RIFOXYA2_FULL_35_10]OGV24949.1 MAG: LPS export ABC transporter periplasmic protein LptC [Ignavibacteria bacterium RIFOXYC2_FULL_35_21]